MFTDSPSSAESVYGSISIYSDDSTARETPITGSLSYTSMSSSCSQSFSRQSGLHDTNLYPPTFLSVVPPPTGDFPPPGLSIVNTPACTQPGIQSAMQIHYPSVIRDQLPPTTQHSTTPQLNAATQFNVPGFVSVDQFYQQTVVPSQYYYSSGQACPAVPIGSQLPSYSALSTIDLQSQKSSIPSASFLAANIYSFYTTKQGSKYLQSLISTHSKAAVQVILPHLHPHLVSCMFHIYGNHVLQAMLNHSRQQLAPILYNLLTDPQILVQACINTYASWVVRVLFREGAIDTGVLNQVIENFSTICNNTCGNYVIQNLLENKKCPKLVIQQLINDAPELVFGKYSSHLLEKLMKENILPKGFLLPFLSKVAVTRYLPAVLESKYGSYVIEKAILKVVQMHGMIDTVVIILRICKHYIQQSSKHYRRILDGPNAPACGDSSCTGDCSLCKFYTTSRRAFDADKLKTIIESIESVNRSFTENIPQYGGLEPLTPPFF